MYSLRKKNLKAEMLVKMPDGTVVPVDQKIHQWKQKIAQNDQKIEIYKKQIAVTKKLHRNCLYDDIRSFLVGICCVGAFIAYTSTKAEVKKVVATGAVVAATLNVGAITALTVQKRKLKKQEALLKQQEQSRDS